MRKFMQELKYVIKAFDHLMTCKNYELEFGLLLSELCLILNKSYVLLENYRKIIFFKESIFQLNNKENFRKLLWNLKYCCDIASNTLSKHRLN